MYGQATAPSSDCILQCDELSRHAAIPGRVAFRPSPVGPLAILSSPRGTATVALLGAQALSWCPANGGEALFWPSAPLSPPAPGEEIHGGIPVCWPWFGRMGPQGSRPHGLARYCRFAVEKTSATAGRTELRMSLVPPPGGLPGFPHAFRLDVRVSVGSALELSLSATNEGMDAFTVTAGFHPYLGVSDADAVFLDGFDGTPYLDWHEGSDGQEPQAIQSGAYRPLPGSRVFSVPRPSCRLCDPGLRRWLVLEAKGHTRWCVWRSPPIPGGTSRNNLFPGDVGSFVCVEPVVFPRCDAIRLQPGESREMSLVLRSEAVP
jgi:D-hexose-6-phosphate mutarotase